METKILIYGQEDLKKSGGFKKKNNCLEMGKEDFFKYLKENDFKIISCYIDISGKILNMEGEILKKFRCFLDNGWIIGTSGIVKEFI